MSFVRKNGWGITWLAMRLKSLPKFIKKKIKHKLYGFQIKKISSSFSKYCINWEGVRLGENGVLAERGWRIIIFTTTIHISFLFFSRTASLKKFKSNEQIFTNLIKTAATTKNVESIPGHSMTQRPAECLWNRAGDPWWLKSPLNACSSLELNLRVWELFFENWLFFISESHPPSIRFALWEKHI